MRSLEMHLSFRINVFQRYNSFPSFLNYYVVAMSNFSLLSNFLWGKFAKIDANIKVARLKVEGRCYCKTARNM